MSDKVTNVEKKGRKLADVEIMNEIHRLPMLDKNFNLMSKEQKAEVLAMAKAAENTVTVTAVTDAIFAVKEKYGIKAEVEETPKKTARRERRRRRMSESGKVERVLRGGENTMILQDANGKIRRFKVRKKGSPKYKDTGIQKKASFKLPDGSTVQVNFVLNPKEGSDSKRVGFEYNEKWYILDNEEFHAEVTELDNKRKNLFTVLEAGTKIEVDAPAEDEVLPEETVEADTDTETEADDAPEPEEADEDVDLEDDDLED